MAGSCAKGVLILSKRILDISGATIGIILFSPLLVCVAILIKSTSSGPVLFKQNRLGKDGSEFAMFKFRTMVKDAENMGTGLFSYEDDPRITKVGRFLRKLSLDELPQLFNVFGGSMSLVGPRPPVTYELGPWKEYTPEMRKRFRVKPGITGLAQISGRNDLDWDRKIMLDNRYVDQFAQSGIGLDIRILARTVWVVLSGRDTVEAIADDGHAEGEVAARARTASKPGQVKK